jgi:hypothetical protein
MEIKRPKSKEEFFELLGDDYSNRNNYFRGQADYSWDITPGIARNKGIKDIRSLLKIESKLIDNFQQKIIDNKLEDLIPKINGSYHESWILLMAAQHYGLPTRLIDFSHDKFAALEFAVADLQYLNKDGALIIYRDIQQIEKEVNSLVLKYPFNLEQSSFFFQGISFRRAKENESLLIESRKVIQGSKFLHRDSENLHKCLSLDCMHRNNLVIIHIPAKLKIILIKHLVEIGKMTYDLYKGKNELDYHSTILKNEFLGLNDSNVSEYHKS